MIDDRELLAVLVALEPLDDRKWDYLDLGRRTFDADGMLAEPWSSGERVLVEVAASLWDTGKVDLGYIASGMGGRHFQAVVDALSVRTGHGFASAPDIAIRRVLGDNRSAKYDRLTAPDRSYSRLPEQPPRERPRSLEL